MNLFSGFSFPKPVSFSSRRVEEDEEHISLSPGFDPGVFSSQPLPHSFAILKWIRCFMQRFLKCKTQRVTLAGRWLPPQPLTSLRLRQPPPRKWNAKRQIDVALMRFLNGAASYSSERGGGWQLRRRLLTGGSTKKPIAFVTSHSYGGMLYRWGKAKATDQGNGTKARRKQMIPRNERRRSGINYKEKIQMSSSPSVSYPCTIFSPFFGHSSSFHQLFYNTHIWHY